MRSTSLLNIKGKDSTSLDNLNKGKGLFEANSTEGQLSYEQFYAANLTLVSLLTIHVHTELTKHKSTLIIIYFPVLFVLPLPPPFAF